MESRSNRGDYSMEVAAPEYETVQERVAHGFEPTVYRVELARQPQPFTVMPTPSEATVSFVGRSEAYIAGKRLPPDEYRVLVSAPWHETREVRVNHDWSPTHFAVNLNRTVPEPGGTFTDALASGGAGPELVVIPPGRFMMGCVSGLDCDPDEKPVHEVRIPQRFALAKYEVTFADWDRCVSAGGCNGYRPDDEGWGRGDHPAINVSWEDARSFAEWLSRETGEKYRLPSESEWEYAARAGTVTKWFSGDDESGLCRYANHADASTEYSDRNTECSDGYGKAYGTRWNFRSQCVWP